MMWTGRGVGKSLVRRMPFQQRTLWYHVGYVGSTFQPPAQGIVTQRTYPLALHSLPRLMTYLTHVSATEKEVKMAKDKVEILCSETEIICSRISSNASQVLDLIEKWHAVSCQFHIPRISRKRNRSSLSSVGAEEFPDESIQTILSITRTCAENMDRLLRHHMHHHLGVDESGSKRPSLFDLSAKSEPDTKPFSRAMEAWRKSRAPHSGKKAAEILQCWGQLYGGDMDHAPTVDEFNIVLEIFADCSSDDYSFFEKGSYPAELAWELFTLLSQLNDPFLLPNVASCSHLIHTLSNHAFVMRYSTRDIDTYMGSDVAAIRAYFIWKQMLDMIHSKDDSFESEVAVALAWRAHVDILNMSSDAMLRRDDCSHNDDLSRNVGRDTEELFVRMLKTQSHVPTNLEGFRHYVSQAFSSTMIAWTKEQNARIENLREDKHEAAQILHGARSVAALLDVMKGEGLLPEPKHYDSSIQAYANCMKKNVMIFQDKNVAKDFLPQVRKFLSDMEIDHVDELINKKCDGVSIDPQNRIDANTYSNVIECYYNNLKSGYGHQNHHKHATKTLERMLDLYEGDLLWVEKGHKPMTWALNRVLQMIVESKPCSEDVVLASKLLRRFRSLPNKTGGLDSKVYSPKLDSSSYSTYLTLLSRVKCKESSTEVVNVLDMMEEDKVKLNSKHYMAAIKGLRQGENGELKLRAKKLLFEAIHEFNQLPLTYQDATDFNAAGLYTAMISPTKSSEAISLLGSLQKQYEETMNPKFKPDFPLYCKVLYAISTDKKVAPWKDEMAFEILGRIEDAYRNGDHQMMPNKLCYLPVINILQRSQLPNAPEVALQLLERMDELYTKSGNKNARPDTPVFHAVMSIIASSEVTSKSKKVWSLYKVMEARFQDGDLSTRPSFDTLSIVLDACTPNTMKHQEYDEAMQIVMQIKNKLDQKAISGMPTATFYNNLIKNFGSLLHQDNQKRQKEDLITSVFKTCCEEGLLDKNILQSIDRYFPELYRKLPGSQNESWNELPKDWSRNSSFFHRKGKRND